MQDRVDREDTLLTNEAIGAALNGGPTVSNNRRVDAEKLQLVVDRQSQSRRADAEDVRQERSLEDDLLNSVGTREGQRLLNETNQFKVDHQEEVFNTEQKAAEAEAEYKRVQTQEGLLRMQESRRAVEQARRAQDAENAITDYYATGQEEDFRTRFDEEAKNIKGWDELTSDEQEAMYRQRRDNVYMRDAESDPYRGVKIARKLGYTPAEYYATSIGQEDLAAQRLVQEKQAENILAQEKEQEAVLESAQAVVDHGDLSNVVPDSSIEGGFTFVKDAAKVSEQGAKAYARTLGLDMEEQEVKDLVNTARATFPAEAAFRTMLQKSVDEDGNVIEGAEDRLFADQQKVRLLAESVVNKSSQGPVLGNASGDLQTAVSGTLSRRNQTTTENATFQVPEEEQKVQKSLEDLGLNQLEVHPDKERTAIVDQIEALSDKLKSKKRPGGRIPLSDQELERTRQELVRAIQKAAEPPLSALPLGINIGIQPK
jgi:hypothetical protein